MERDPMTEKRGKARPYGRLGPVLYSAAYQKWRDAVKRNDERGIAEANAEHRKFINANHPWWRIQKDAA
jgi:hypothetical protein